MKRMVNIAGTLPKDEANGLDVYGRELAGALLSRQRFFVVGVVETDSVKTKGADLVPVPTVAFKMIELVPVDHAVEAQVSALLQALTHERRGGGQVSFDFEGAAEAADEGVPAGPAALESGDGMFFEVVDGGPGRFSLLLCSQYVRGLTQRQGLVRDELGEIPPGDYQLAQLDGAVRELAEKVLADWNSGEGSVIDAEVIEDEELEEGDSE